MSTESIIWQLLESQVMIYIVPYLVRALKLYTTCTSHAQILLYMDTLQAEVESPPTDWQHPASCYQSQIQNQSEKPMLCSCQVRFLCGVVWHQWQERNTRIFQREIMRKFSLFRKLYEDILVLSQACHWKAVNSIQDQQIVRTWKLSLILLFKKKLVISTSSIVKEE